jgi:hypothetical protein
MSIGSAIANVGALKQKIDKTNAITVQLRNVRMEPSKGRTYRSIVHAILVRRMAFGKRRSKRLRTYRTGA